MDVRCTFLHGFREQCIDQANDRRVVITFEKIFGFRQLVGEGFQVQRFIEVGHHRAGVVALLIQITQQTFEIRSFVAREFQWHAQMTTHFGKHRRLHA